MVEAAEKRNKHKMGFLILCFVLFITAYSQNAKVDSLKRLILSGKKDTVQVNRMIALSQLFLKLKQYDSSDSLLRKSDTLSANLNYKKGIAAGYRGYGKIATARDELDKALELYQKSVAMYEALHEEQIVAEIYGGMGNVYYKKTLYSEAIQFYIKALKLNEKLGNKKSIAGYSGNIGAVYQSIDEPHKAIEFYEKAIKINRELQNQQGIAINLACLGNVYIDLKEYDAALKNHMQALEINEKIGDSTYISNSLANIAGVYQTKGDYNKALEFIFRATEMLDADNLQQTILNLQTAGIIYQKQKKYKEAEKQFLRAEKLLEKYNSLGTKARNDKFLSAVYDSLHDYKKSLSYFRSHIGLRDSIFNSENDKKIIESQLQFEYEKKAAADSVKTAEEKKVVEVQLRYERTQRWALYGGLALIALFAVFMFNRFRITKKQKNIIEHKEKETQLQKNIIEEKHKEITDSINYAERIQRSFLATKEILDSSLGDYFVFFKPKDVVSGDFYWAAKLNNGHFAMITADSTGHGVPGAIMSLLNITSIEGAIKDGYKMPSEILNETRKTIIERLKHDGSAEGGKDGMDCSLCIYDFTAMKLYVSAANNPVWIVREREVIEVRPDKMPVGKHDNDRNPFTQQEIQLQKGDVVYTLTDGFPDQFGGPNGKKFMSKRLRELLIANAHIPMQEQNKMLEATFSGWVGQLEQVDDVTIMGIRV